MFTDDDLVTPQHMIDMYAALPNAELAIVPATSHFLNQEKLVNTLLVDFLTKAPVATVAPIRRASKPQASPGWPLHRVRLVHAGRAGGRRHLGGRHDPARASAG